MRAIKTVALTGIGGYGKVYGSAFLEECEKRGLDFVGCVDPFYEQCDYIEAIRKKNIPVFKTMEEFYRGRKADLMCIATPIHLHAPQTCFALARGSHVLCEKPLCATMEEAKRMGEAQNLSGRKVAVGYQFSYNPGILKIKSGILAGAYGKPLLFRSIVLGPRDRLYFERKWAGKIKVDGHYVYDSVANNACAHYLHNLLFLAGKELGSSAFAVSHETELYRLNHIENFDTITTRIRTDSGVTLFFAASHGVDQWIGPVFELEFEKAVIRCDMNTRLIEILFRDGRKEEQHLAEDPQQREKIWSVIRSIDSGEDPVCGIKTAMAHTKFINDIQASVPVRNFDPARIRTMPDEVNPQSTVIYGEGLCRQLEDCYKKAALLSETEK